MKDPKKVSLQLQIDQVVDGVEYEGKIALGEVDISYRIVCAKSIPEIDAMTSPPSGLPELREFIWLTTKVGDREISLDDECCAFFYAILVGIMVRFYYDPQTRASNSGTLGMVVRGEGGSLPSGVTINLGMKTSMRTTLSGEMQDSLNRAFGCEF